MTPPLSLTGRYQVVLLAGTGSAEAQAFADRLVAALKAALNQLGVNPKKFLAPIMSGVADPDLDRKMPSVAIFVGTSPSPALNDIDQARLDTLLVDGTLIIPVVDDPTSFARLVPAQIAHLNGLSFADCGADLERLSARILEGFSLLRERRRLFISYRRVETSGVATQLYEALDAAGFDVFLDTHGVIRPGEPFQEVLWHRLADTDVALVLDSPGFLASRWTEEELARANVSNIQILQLLWPGQEESAAAAFSTYHPLDKAEFEVADFLGPAARLVESTVTTVVDEVEGLRARALAARHAFLVREFLVEARAAGLAVHMTLDRSLIVSTVSNIKRLIRPAIGIPDAESYEKLEDLHKREIASGRDFTPPPILLYDQTGIRARWLSHLEWLNGSVSSARSVSLAGAKSWLARLASEGAA